MNLNQAAVLALATGLLFLPGKGVGRAQGGISTEGPLTLFRTGGNESLLSLNLPFNAPPSNAVPVLRLDFGFATSEPDDSSTFYDSFSLTLQRGDNSATALLATADRTGIQWAPPASGALPINASEIRRAETNFPSLSPDLAIKFAFSVSFALPSVLTGGPLKLFFDLFDNLNPAHSLAFVRDVRIESAILPPVKLLSTTPVTAAFVEETGAILNEANRTFTLPRPAGNRFYVVQADQLTRIVSARAVGSQLLIEYAFPQLALQSAAEVTGLFADETGAVLDQVTRTFRTSPPGGKRFYRIRSEVKTRITRLRLQGAEAVLDYEALP
jgi:hypothetical protein